MLDLLAGFKLRLLKNGVLVEEGSGKNSLPSPALCLVELAAAAARRGDPLAGGELTSTGTLTAAAAIVRRAKRGERKLRTCWWTRWSYASREKRPSRSKSKGRRPSTARSSRIGIEGTVRNGTTPAQIGSA